MCLFELIMQTDGWRLVSFLHGGKGVLSVNSVTAMRDYCIGCLPYGGRMYYATRHVMLTCLACYIMQLCVCGWKIR